MWVEPVNSSAIAAVGWDDGEVIVHFQSGKTYSYAAPESVARELASAPSPGSMLNEQVKPKYSAHEYSLWGTLMQKLVQIALQAALKRI
jgi:hypothetical protein